MVNPALLGAVEEYLGRLQSIHAKKRGTPELSSRAALENLLNAVGESLTPAVQATAELKDTGSGHPDYGLFETRSDAPRAVVEVKAPAEEVPHTADGKQVSKYWEHYGCVLVTNYRDFLLVTRDQDGGGAPRVEGRCQLAADADEFWRSDPAALAESKAEELVDFLTNVMRRAAPVLRPRDLAADLARHAREARRRLERQKTEALEPLQRAMEQALGLHFTGEEGQHFFRSSLVQTLFYGLFSGWMLWRPDPLRKPGAFDWREASEYLALPLIGALYEEIARPSRLKDFNLREPLEWATASLNNVDEAEFFNTFDADHAITLFYEPFLEAFDPDLREQYGVWFTPPEIVKYMVGRVDQLLRSELGIADGLADESVYVLDPAAGTGSYVLEVARKIHQTLTDQGHGAMAPGKVRKALTSRVFGFEILPAPYVVAHLQLGVLLRELGTKFAPDQRAGVFLTNALTGWEPPKGAKQTLAFAFLQDEQEAAAKVKRESPVLVILGNPPYNGFAGVAQEEEADLIQPYKEGLFEQWGVSKQSLDDLYVRFYRLAERRIGEIGGRGIVCYISNYSWLDGLSHPVMRQRLLTHFDQVWIDNCNGDKYRTGKRTPAGKSDQSMFTAEGQPVGIQVGTAVATLVKKGASPAGQVAQVHLRDLWGLSSDKRQDLVASLADPAAHSRYTVLSPAAASRYALTAGAAAVDYWKWHSVAELFARSHSGVKTNSDELVIDFERDALEQRMRDYCDKRIGDAEIKRRYPKAGESRPDYDATHGRAENIHLGFRPAHVHRLMYRPFDYRWIYNEPSTRLVNSPRPEFVRDAALKGQVFLEVRQKLPTPAWDRGLVCTTLGETLGNGTSTYMPLLRLAEDLHGVRTEPNVRAEVMEALGAVMGVPVFLPKVQVYAPGAIDAAGTLFHHVVAVLWSPAYRKENEAALRQDWPRVPIPAAPDLLEASAALGRAVSDLLLPDRPVAGVTTGKLRPELRTLAVPTKVGGGAIEEPADTKVMAGWGFRGQKNAVMCGKGRVAKHAADPDEALDIYINDTVYWSNVPADVWDMTIGGYPVVKKWLSYREHKVLGRALTGEELSYVTEVARRLKALLLMSADLDANYRAAAAAPQVALPAAKD